jgi:hypothetical protein
MRKTLAALVILFVSAALCQAQTARKREPHWESNLSLGYIDYTSVQNPPEGFVDDMTRHFAIVKSFWYFPFLPRIVSLGLSFDYVVDDLPISLNAALNLPTKFFVPFVSAGTGFSFSGNSLQNYGGGIKLRTGKKFGLILEYRHYRIKKKTLTSFPDDPSSYVIRDSDYLGFGFAYLY